MKSKAGKVFMSLLAVVLMVCFMPKMTAFAASTVTGDVGGFTVTGTISRNSTSATANTSFALPSNWCSAKATVYYQHAGVIYYTEATDSTTQSGGVSATATAHITTAVSVLGAKGTHSLSYSGYTWTDVSTSGSNPSNAVRP